jgi:hypothetical protein
MIQILRLLSLSVHKCYVYMHVFICVRMLDSLGLLHSIIIAFTFYSTHLLPDLHSSSDVLSSIE